MIGTNQTAFDLNAHRQLRRTTNQTLQLVACGFPVPYRLCQSPSKWPIFMRASQASPASRAISGATAHHSIASAPKLADKFNPRA